MQKIFSKRVKEAAVKIANYRWLQSAFGKINRHKVVFLAYHGISKDTERLDAWTLVRESAFKQQMLFVRENFDCLTIDEAISGLRRDKGKPGAVVTFDDGYANNLEIAMPILKELRLPATIYVTTGNVIERKLFWPDKIWMALNLAEVKYIDLIKLGKPLKAYNFRCNRPEWYESVLALLEDIKKVHPAEREKTVDEIIEHIKQASGQDFSLPTENNVFSPLTGDQIRELASEDLISIGSHTHCHNLLNQIPTKDAETTILKSKALLQKMTGNEIRHFSYPNGNVNENILDIVQRSGFKSAVTYQSGFFKLGVNAYKIKRLGIGSENSLREFKARITGIFELKKWLQKQSLM